MQIRGIIPEQYAEVAHGSKSLEEAREEWEEYRRRSSKNIKNKIDLKFRPSKKDLTDRGIVPDWDNPNMLQEERQKNKDSLTMKYNQRMDPNEAHARAIIDQHQLFSNKVNSKYIHIILAHNITYIHYTLHITHYIHCLGL